jgi:hypothetical protein
MSLKSRKKLPLVHLTLRISPKLRTELLREAKADGRPVSNYARWILEKHIASLREPAAETTPVDQAA